MTQIYLDELDTVRVDMTPDRRFARDAAIKRDLLKMGRLTERLGRAAMRAVELRGGDPAPCLRGIGQARRICREIRAEAQHRQ